MVALRDEKKKGYVLNETRMTLKELQTVCYQFIIYEISVACTFIPSFIISCDYS